MSIELVMPFSYLILCRPLLLLPPVPPSNRVFSNESTLRMRWPKYWISDAIQPSHPLVPFSSCLQSFPASGSFPVSQFFASGGQSIGVSASASVLLMNIQDWFPLGWTGWISLQSKRFSRVFSNIIVQKYRFFGAQLSLWLNSHIFSRLLEKP